MRMTEKIVIGMTGPFGSGCSYIAENIIASSGYEYISLSDILKQEIRNNNYTRSDLQDKGNELREKQGAGYLAQKAIEKIDSSEHTKFVIDSIRNTHEIEEFKKKFTKFYLIATWADEDTRWSRVSGKYQNNLHLFKTDDKRDKDE